MSSRERVKHIGYGHQVGQTELQQGEAQRRLPTAEEIAEMKTERERGLDLTIRNSAVQLAIQAIAAGPNASTHLGDATLVQIAQDLYSFLKGTK